jgi:uncharacterized membrane protein
MVQHPLLVLRTLLTPANGGFLLALLGPLLVLPLLGTRYLIPILPTLVLLMLSSRDAVHTVHFQYSLPLLAFLFLAAASGLGRLARRGLSLRRLALPWAVAAVVGFHVWATIGTHILRRDPAETACLAAAAQVPVGAAISVSQDCLHALSERVDAYQYPYLIQPGSTRARWDPVPLAVRHARLEFLLLQGKDGGDEKEQAIVQRFAFRELFRTPEVRLYQREPGALPAE